MFIDSVKLTVSSGKGGQGAVSFRREKFMPKGGPDGGDGGKGGDVYFIVDKNTHTLSHFKGKKVLKAQNGRPGEGRRKHGKDGKPLVLIVPPGTEVRDANTNELLLDLVDDGQKVLFLEGGKGGKGNWHFKSSTNQRPTYAQPGLPGATREIRLELKLIADVGLVGFPNVGKSTLISVISNAKPQIADYEFTTLTPKLGVVNIDEFRSFVMADIPGIIENAHLGKGLGIEFLKHIERTNAILYMIDLTSYRDSIYQLKTLKKELKEYSKKLSKKNYAIALTKCDSIDIEKIYEFFKRLNIKPTESKYKADSNYPSYFDEKTFILPISSISNINLNTLKFALYDLIKRSNEENSI